MLEKGEEKQREGMKKVIGVGGILIHIEREFV